jgi:hypothetical protein
MYHTSATEIDVLSISFENLPQDAERQPLTNSSLLRTIRVPLITACDRGPYTEQVKLRRK